MTDYFALLQQPRRPWLDLEKLEDKYRELARNTHPDQSPGSDFAEVNTAYRTLRDPRLRLQHLLTLAGKPPSSGASDVPADLVELFMNIAPVIKHGEKHEIETSLARLQELLGETLQQVRALNGRWDESLVPQVETLYCRLSFLARWRDLLEERHFG